MNRFIRIEGTRFINLDALRELTWHENGDIEARYSSYDYEVFHFNSVEDSRRTFNKILRKLELADELDAPKCFNNPIGDLCEAMNTQVGGRIKNACIRNNIRTIGDLVTFGKTKFENQRNIGASCVVNITAFLRDTYGYEWKY